jgi:hypothetical protein
VHRTRGFILFIICLRFVRLSRYSAQIDKATFRASTSSCARAALHQVTSQYHRDSVLLGRWQNIRATDVQAREIKWIEENLERTRKIAGSGIADKERLIKVLLPLLPLQFQPVLDSEEFDVDQRLRKANNGYRSSYRDNCAGS